MAFACSSHWHAAWACWDVFRWHLLVVTLQMGTGSDLPASSFNVMTLLMMLHQWGVVQAENARRIHH